MPAAFLLALGDLRDRAVLRVLALSVAITLGAFALAGGALWWGLDAWLGTFVGHGTLAALAAGVVMLGAMWLLFRIVAVAVVGLFADTIVAAVERRHYPARAATARALPTGRSAAMALASATRVVLVNLLFAPLYLALLVSGIGAPIAFFLVNAWLLGRDLGDMVAARHLPVRALPRWRRAHRIERSVLGIAAAGCFAIPLLNVLAPVLGATLATHLFHRGYDA